ncbi:MFS general substrate transporter [Dacryopinax primogenitus]|uniref:MFS general substrate transporter n=1 Tax=Dacryopinax primogenitus (strain DJM 731) TaxID=1858805 RepID=M5GAP1_DACPD|nr:MFS general substrate transporter [Dacryopinax primogenitus]EJU03032.1 MFS general substrate transporter [Dacryopinax primogenitus]
MFSTLGFSDSQIGIFMTLTLLGDVFISLLLTLVADKIGRRRILVAGALLMLISGVVFAISSSFSILLLAAIVGVISPSGNEIGPFRSVEESIQAQITPPHLRAEIFAISGIVDALSTALGQISIGFFTRYMKGKGWSELAGYRATFWLYAACAAVKLGLTLLMSEECEVEPVREYMPVSTDEDIPLSAKSSPQTEPPTPIALEDNPRGVWSTIVSSFPTFSEESKPIVLKLALLLGLGSGASGLVPMSIIVYFFSQTFHLPTNILGLIFFTTSLVSDIAQLLSATVAKRLGLIKTMFVTHLPSSLLLALIPIPNVYLASTVLVIRFCTGTMDVAPRTALISQLVLGEERTSVMGILNTVRTLTQAVGPWLSGWLSEGGRLWISFVVAAVLKSSYDFGLLAMFWNARPREEVVVQNNDDRHEQDEESI